MNLPIRPPIEDNWVSRQQLERYLDEVEGIVRAHEERIRDLEEALEVNIAVLRKRLDRLDPAGRKRLTLTDAELLAVADGEPLG